MKKSDILRIINEKQNRVNTFYSISENDLRKAQRAIKAMCFFGWKESRATEIITSDLAAGVINWYPGYLVREMENSSRRV